MSDRLLELAAKINAAGVIINNLFQIKDGWQANVHDGENGYEFGKDACPYKALEKAFANLKPKKKSGADYA